MEEGDDPPLILTTVTGISRCFLLRGVIHMPLLGNYSLTD